MKIGCILLAAGSGSRFGGDKLRHPVDGASMAERACALHAGLGYASRILVSRPGDAYIADVAKKHGFVLAVNERAAMGIGTSASAGVNALLAQDASVDGALFAVCDQPYLTDRTVLALIRRFLEAPDAIVAPVCGGRRGNPVIFPRALLGEFASLTGDVGGSAIIRAHSDRLLTVPGGDPAEFFDIDTRSCEMRNTDADNSER